MAAENASVDDGFVDRVELPSMGSDGGDQRAHRLARRVGCDEEQALAVLEGSRDLPVLGMSGRLLSLAAERLRLAIDKVLEAGQHRPREFGGQAGCRVFTEAVLDQLGITLWPTAALAAKATGWMSNPTRYNDRSDVSSYGRIWTVHDGRCRNV